MTWDPNITQRVLAAIDRSEDPHLAIDILRDEVSRQSEAMRRMDQDIKMLQDAERDRLTKTGVWTIVKGKLDEKAIDWMKWGVRGVIGSVGLAFASLIGWVLKLAWKGIAA